MQKIALLVLLTNSKIYLLKTTYLKHKEEEQPGM